VPADHTILQAFGAETAAAFVLMFVVASTALDPAGDPKKIPLRMAMTIPLLIFVLGPVSSMCINPARAFGPAVVSGYWDAHWIWWTAPFLGGFAAFVPYKFVLQQRSASSTKEEEQL
jgi:glycerol uptake facilitator-like aquaporin